MQLQRLLGKALMVVTLLGYAGAVSAKDDSPTLSPRTLPVGQYCGATGKVVRGVPVGSLTQWVIVMRRPRKCPAQVFTIAAPDSLRVGQKVYVEEVSATIMRLNFQGKDIRHASIRWIDAYHAANPAKSKQ